MSNVPAKFYELCRLCLSHSGIKLSIFDDEGTQRNYPLKIMTCLSILVSEQDMLPSNICKSCSYKLELLHEFREKSRKSEMILKQYLSNADFMSAEAQEYLNSMAALATSGGPPPPPTAETNSVTSVKPDETEAERTVGNTVRSDVEEDQNTMNGLSDDKMCEDLDSDDEGALRIAESEPETNTTPSADDVKQEIDDDEDDQVGKRIPKTEIMSDDEKSMDESTSIENNEAYFTNTETNSSSYVINTSSKSESNSLLRSLMSGPPHNSRMITTQHSQPPRSPSSISENEVLANRTNLPTPVTNYNNANNRIKSESSRQSSGRRKQSCPLRAAEVPFLNRTSPVHNHNGSYNGVTITPVSDPRSRSREAISRLLEAAHYTEREERGSYSPDTGGEGELADGEDDIEEVEVSGGEDPTNNSWCNNSMFRSTRQPALAKRVDLACSNCGTRTTTIWRRNPLGERVCNACGLYFKLHNVNRPATMRRDTIHTRRRRPRGDKRTRHNKKAASECTSGGNSGSEECDDMLVALRRQIQPHLMLAALQQTSSYPAIVQQQQNVRSFKSEPADEAPLNLVAGSQ